jgi:hypothetical protein
MRETVEFLSAHTLGKAEDATDYSFKTKSHETDCAQSANSSARRLETDSGIDFADNALKNR